MRQKLTFLFWLPLLGVMALICGCDPKTGKPVIVSPPSKPVSLISPIDFFTPDQKRLSRHLDWSVGCFKIEYAGPRASVGERLSVWKEGRKEDGNSSSQIEAGVGELSIAVRPGNSSDNYQVTTDLSNGSGSASGNGTYSRPMLGSWSTKLATIDKPVELKRGEEVVVWALMHFKSKLGVSHSSPSNEPILDQVKRADWALVLSVELDPPQRP